MATSENPATDSRFTDFGDMQAKLGDSSQVIENGLQAYFNRLFLGSPTPHDEENGTELANMLKDGIWADKDFAPGSTDTDNSIMVHMVQASIIAEAWNAGQVAIAKWSEDGPFGSNWKFNPCFGGDRYGLDHAVGCKYGKNYMIVSLVTHSGERR